MSRIRQGLVSRRTFVDDTSIIKESSTQKMSLLKVALQVKREVTS